VSRNRLTRVAALAAALVVVFAGTAQADATNRNSCRYSYDDYWRDMDVTYGATPSVASAQPGEQIALNGLRLSAALPAWLAQYGYNFGLLQSGENEIPVTVWAAVRATNTAERVQVHEIETTAFTTITTSNGQFVSATPISYDIPPLGATQWTARGGPVAFSQASSGSLPELPIGPGGRMLKPRGSVYIQATLGPATLGLDCVTGTYFAQGSERQEAAPEPFAEVAVPAFSCLGAVPAATSVASVSVDLVRRRGLAPAKAGTPYGYAPSVSYRLPAAYLSALRDAGLLVEGDNPVSGTVTAAIDGATAGRRVLSGPAAAANVRLTGGTIKVGESDDLAGEATLASGSWTPSGAAALAFSAAAPGALGPLTVDGVTGTVQPYGSVYLRLALGASRLSLDCVSGVVSVAGGAPPYSVLGNQPGGDQGRYVIERNQLDAFATAHLVPGLVAPTPTPTATPTVVPTVVPTPVPTVAATATPVPTPAPPAPAAARVAIRSSSLKVARGRRVNVSLGCAGASSCTGSVVVRTAAKVKLGKRAKRVLTLTRSARYTVEAGGRVTVRLTLSRDARALLKRVKRVSVRVVITPRGASQITRRVTLRR
jgi:hypothetical protein